MHPHRSRRLIAAAIFIILIALPWIWIGRQYRQLKLDRALIAAIRQKDATKVDSLLAAGANPSARDTHGDTPGDIQENALSLRDRLYSLFHPPPPDRSRTALFKALDAESPRIFKVLIGAGADVNATDDYGRTALFVAAYDGQSDCVNALISAGAAVNLKDDQGNTALDQAKANNHPEVTTILRQAGAKD